MKLPSPIRNVRSVIFTSVLFLLAGSCAAQNQRVIHPGDWINGLRVSIRLDQSSTQARPVFRVQLQNVGDDDLLLNVGSMALTGSNEYSTAISLTLFNSDGTSLRLEHIRTLEDSDANDKPLLLPLPSGATFSLPVHLEDYRVAGSLGSHYELKPGIYSIQASFNGSNAASNIQPLAQAGLFHPRFDESAPFDRVITQSVGSLTSNKLQFEISARS